MRWLLLAWLGGCAAPEAPVAGGAPTDDTDTVADTDVVATQDRWWCDLEVTDTAPPSTDTGAAGDPDAVVTWEGKTDAATGLGDISYTSDNPNTGASCVLEFLVPSAQTTDACADCDFAWAMVLGAPTVGSDGGGCAPGLALEGATLYLGDSDGDMMVSADGVTWDAASGGYSKVFFGYWSFGWTAD